jgi:hypothetical protein
MKTHENSMAPTPRGLSVVLPTGVAIQRPGLTGDGDHRVPAAKPEDPARGRLCPGLANAS